MKIKEYLYKKTEGCIVQAICGRIQVPPTTESWSLGREVFWKAKIGIRYLTSALGTLVKLFPTNHESCRLDVWKMRAGTCSHSVACTENPTPNSIMNYRGPSLALEMACCLHLSAPACVWVELAGWSPSQSYTAVKGCRDICYLKSWVDLWMAKI